MKQIIKPNLFIVGAAKSGTTSLYNYLKMHPGIFFSERKEPYYFSSKYVDFNHNGKGDRQKEQFVRDLEKYEKLFSKWNGEKIIGEASVDYLYYSECADDIKKYSPNAKIIIMLRNPIDRAYSAYMHLIRDVRENQTFEEALKLEESRIKNNYSFIWRYKQVGLYSNQVKRYLEIFGKNNVKIIIFGDFMKNTDLILKEIYNFLEISDEGNIGYKKIHNKSGKPKVKWINEILYNKDLKIKKMKYLIPIKCRKKIKYWIVSKNTIRIRMLEKQRSYLIEYFREDILKLEKIINSDLSKWLES